MALFLLRRKVVWGQATLVYMKLWPRPLDAWLSHLPQLHPRSHLRPPPSPVRHTLVEIPTQASEPRQMPPSL